MNKIDTNRTEIEKLCKQYNVSKLYVFGSVLTNDFNENSDIDLLVNFEKINLEDYYFDNYYNLKFSLEKVLNRPIDLLEEKALKNPYFLQSINQ